MPLRFDVQHLSEHVQLVNVPVPVRLPRENVSDIAIGRSHCVALLKRGDVFEWGERFLVQGMEAAENQIATILEAQQRMRTDDGDVNFLGGSDMKHMDQIKLDCGKVHLATPIRIDLEGSILNILAAGDVTAVMADGAPPIAWSFCETMAKVSDRLKPALMSFRWLHKSTRIEMQSSDSVFAVTGYNPTWRKQEIVKREPILNFDAIAPKRRPPVVLLRSEVNNSE